MKTKKTALLTAPLILLVLCFFVAPDAAYAVKDKKKNEQEQLENSIDSVKKNRQVAGGAIENQTGRLSEFEKNAAENVAPHEAH